MFKKIKETLAITTMLFSFKSDLNNWVLKNFTHDEQYQFYLEFKKDKKETIKKLEKLMQLDEKEQKQAKKVPNEVVQESKENNNNERALRSFYVTGPQHEKKLKTNLNTIIKKAREDDISGPYEGLSSTELRDELQYVERIYQYTSIVFSDDIEFIDETDNPYDENALLVKVDGLKVGHILRKHQNEVRNMLSKGMKFHGKILGGRYKTFNWETDKVETVNTDHFFVVEENYHQGS